VLRVIRQLQGAVNFLIISIIATDFRPVKRKSQFFTHKLRHGTKNMGRRMGFLAMRRRENSLTRAAAG
jgi:hypothetical protein